MRQDATLSYTALSLYGGRSYPSSNLRATCIRLAFALRNIERGQLLWIAEEARTAFHKHRVETFIFPTYDAISV